ncbi:prolipoprotein diacylglyceryl transferase [Amycolatopsis taiwanensis]|uniref:prolipoprotein diacylglyceryl transferase n=1 Tax=Amycolatopsis taiwanensis TaxID=342230 RepID=UPI00255643D3|nr:prolipoprotein diacylglyceryl transferase [Amycolatopsis taiwanensis]
MARVNSASAVFLATIPSPERGVWYLGPIPIRAYALCIIAGIILAIWWGERRWVQRGGAKNTVIDIAIFAVPFGLVGGRLYHVITDWWRYFGPGKNPVQALFIWDGGLGIWGAIALGGVGAWIGCRRKGIPLPAMADAIAPGIVTAQAIGRIGNYFNQELYGAHTTLPWGLEIYQRFDPNNPSIPDQGPTGVAFGHIPLQDSPVHPTFLYELLWNLAIAGLVVWADRRFKLGHGRAFALYVAGYTLGRFWIELMRTDDATHVLGVRVNVWVALLVCASAVAYIVLARRRGPRETPESLRGKQDSAEATTSDEADDSGSSEPKAAVSTQDESSTERKTE